MSAPAEPLPDCYEGDPELLPPAEAARRIRAHVAPTRERLAGEVETVALPDALDRVIAADVAAPFDVPGHTNSAMDGWAVRGDRLPADGTRAFRVAGTAWAGRAFAGECGADDAVRVMTGAAMPAGTDTVVMKEHAGERGDAVEIGAGHRTGQHVRAAGEDLRAGTTVVRAGTRLGPAELGMLASIGRAEVTVHRRLRVAYFSTGDELRPLGEPVAPGIIYDSNRYTLYAMLRRLGVEPVDLGIVRDERAAVRAALEDAAGRADAVVSSGGASTGEADFVKSVLDEIGRVGFWRIAIRPGRPLAFGFVDDAVYFGLPGNPVAVMVTFYQFVRPALRTMAGEREPREPTVEAVCTSPLRKKPGRIEYYRAVLERDAAGRSSVRATGKTGSGLLHTMSDANCFIILPEDGESVEPGATVEVQPFYGLV